MESLGTAMATTGTAVDPPENTRSSRWYWCKTGSCVSTETAVDSAGKSGYLKKSAGVES